MSFPRPTLAQLRAQSRQFLQARLVGADVTLRRSVLTTYADMIAGLVYSEYGYLDFLSQQLLPDTAESFYLARWASIYGLVRVGASVAAGNVVFTGTSGTVIHSGTVLQANNQAQYLTQSPVTLSGGSGTVAVDAILGGTAGNQAALAPLSLVIAIAGVAGTPAFDASGATGGLDVESDASLRARLLERIQQPPQGGAYADYVLWASLVPGVTRVFVYNGATGLATDGTLGPISGPGTVNVYFVMDGRSNIIPLTADVAAVQTSINSLKPVTASVTVFAPTAVPLNVTLGELSPNNVTTHAAIITSLKDMLTRLAIPGGTIYYDQIVDAIMQSAGVIFASVTLPAGQHDTTVSAGQISTLGTVTFP